MADVIVSPTLKDGVWAVPSGYVLASDGLAHAEPGAGIAMRVRVRCPIVPTRNAPGGGVSSPATGTITFVQHGDGTTRVITRGTGWSPRILYTWWLSYITLTWPLTATPPPPTAVASTPLSPALPVDALAVSPLAPLHVGYTGMMGGADPGVFFSDAQGRIDQHIVVDYECWRYVGGALTPNGPLSNKNRVTATSVPVGVYAKATLGTVPQNMAVVYTAKTAGVANISVTYVDPAAVNQALSVTVSGTAITVNLATDSNGVITSTASAIITAIGNSAAASALVTAANAAGSSGAGLVPAIAQTFLTATVTHSMGAWLRKYIGDYALADRPSKCANYDARYDPDSPSYNAAVALDGDCRYWQAIDPATVPAVVPVGGATQGYPSLAAGSPYPVFWAWNHLRLANHFDGLSHSFFGGDTEYHRIDGVVRAADAVIVAI